MKALLLVVILAALSLPAVATAGLTPTPPGARSASATQHLPGGDTATLTVATTSTQTVSPYAVAGSCGNIGYYGQVRYNNAVGITLWTYRQDFYVNYCRYMVTGVTNLWDSPASTCCNWGWHGTITNQHSGTPSSVVSSYTKGHFANCVPWPVSVCQDKYPVIQLAINGNGNLTGFNWSTG